MPNCEAIATEILTTCYRETLLNAKIHPTMAYVASHDLVRSDTKVGRRRLAHTLKAQTIYQSSCQVLERLPRSMLFCRYVDTV